MIDASSSGVPYRGMRRFPEEETEHEGILYCYAYGDLIYRNVFERSLSLPPLLLSLRSSSPSSRPFLSPRLSLLPSFSFSLAPLSLLHLPSPLSLRHHPSPLFPPVGYHVYGWRDLFDTAVRWRQACEPMDVVYWLDR